MATHIFSMRIDEGALARLNAHALERGETRSAAVGRLIEEGLRTALFPGVMFQDGVGGRRARLARGPDVWELINVYRDTEGADDERMAATCEWTGLPPRWVQVALDYYAAYPGEIDERLRKNDSWSEEAYLEHLRDRAVIAR